VVHPEEHRARRRTVPRSAAGAGREPDQLQRVTVRVAELERAHAAVHRRQALRSAVADRVPSGAAAQVAVGGVHIVHHDGQVLEPQVVAAAVHRVGPARRGNLHQRNRVRPQSQQGLFRRAPLNPERNHRRRVYCAAPKEGEAQCVLVEPFGLAEVGYDAAEPRNAHRWWPACKCHGCQGQRGRGSHTRRGGPGHAARVQHAHTDGHRRLLFSNTPKRSSARYATPSFPGGPVRFGPVSRQPAWRVA